MRDLVIIGGGPAGLTAAIYAMRGGLKTAIVEKYFVGGQAATTAEIENYPGFIGISGPELAQKLEAHAGHFGAEFIYEEVSEVDLSGSVKVVKTNANIYEAKAVIIATGSRPRKLGITGEERFAGHGVSYCATCDGAFYRNKKTAVIGGGNTALEDAVYLSGLCEKVYLIHRRDTFRADMSLVKRLKAHPNIITITNAVVDEIIGEQVVCGITVITGKKEVIDCDGVFVAIGAIPNTALFAGKLELEDGYIVTDNNMAASLPGVFAAGDVRVTALRQIITACADGAVAVRGVLDYIAAL